MGKTKDLGHLASMALYDASGNMTLPANLKINGSADVATQAYVGTQLGSYTPSTRSITINGTTYDLSADRSWTITSMIYPAAGIALSTGSAWGTSITNNSANWNTAYGWGNHASAGYLTGITSSQVTTALGFTPYNSTNPSGYITGITSSMVTTALGFTPYNSTNPSGYITSSALSSYLPLSGGTMSGDITFVNLRSNADSSYGFIGRNVYADTVNGIGADPLELNYYSGGSVIIGTGTTGSKALYAGSLYDSGNRVITTGNIGSQSVSYASTAGSAPANGGTSTYATYLNPLSGDGNYKLAYTADGARTNAGEWGRAVMYYVPNGQTYGIRVDRADYASSASSASSAGSLSANASATDIYNNGWFRNNNGQQGLYSQAYGVHFYGRDSSSWGITGSGGNVSLAFYSNHQTSLRGYVYADTSNNIGFLDNGGNWSFRTNGGTVYAYAYRGSGNVGGTGEASWHPAGIYCGSTNWMYGTTYKNGTTTSGQGWMYLDWNYGHSVVGVYASTRYQGVWSMGGAYTLSEDGTSTGNLYGLAWSHPNAGGQAGYLTNHGLIHMMYGTAFATISDNIWCRNNITAYSDIRVKENIEVIENAMDKINAIRGVTFTRNDVPDTKKRHAGIIAQEVQKVLPEVITENISNGHLSVAYGNMVGLTIEGLKEHDKIIKQQAEEIKQLKDIINGLTK